MTVPLRHNSRCILVRKVSKLISLDRISAWVLLLLGAGCLLYPRLNADLFYYLSAALVTASAIALWVHFWVQKSGLRFLEALLCSLLAALFWSHRLVPSSLIVGLFVFYLIFNLFCETVQLVLDIREKSKQKWFHLLMSIFYFLLILLVILYRQSDLEDIIRYFGIYLLIQAFQSFWLLYHIDHPKSSRQSTMAIWTSLPVYIVSFLPGLYLRLSSTHKMKNFRQMKPEVKNDEEVNLQVFIHTGMSGAHMLGHMTFAYKGMMFSYGNYDKSEEKFFRSIGPGVFFTVPAEIYVNNSCIYEQSTLYEYGIHLTKKQEELLVEKIRKIFDETYRWYCPMEACKNGWRDLKEYESDYSSRLWFRTGAKFRKFHSSQWKTYWVLGDNCSLFADDLLSSLGCLIPHKTGVVTPGEYFEYFEEAYANPQSNVISRWWHDARFPETLYPTLG